MSRNEAQPSSGLCKTMVWNYYPDSLRYQGIWPSPILAQAHTLKGASPVVSNFSRCTPYCSLLYKIKQHLAFRKTFCFSYFPLFLLDLSTYFPNLLEFTPNTISSRLDSIVPVFSVKVWHHLASHFWVHNLLLNFDFSIANVNFLLKPIYKKKQNKTNKNKTKQTNKQNV